MNTEVMTVQELAKEMHISLPKAYQLVNEPGFPVVHVGTRKLIPRSAFKEWLIIHSQNE